MRGKRFGLVGTLVWLGFLSGAAAAVGPAFTQVSGSPFGTGTSPQYVAFDPSGDLLATANSGSGNVSVFSVSGSGSGSALTPVSGSPFAAGTDPVAVAFDPAGDLVAVANAGSSTVSVFSLSGSGAGATLTPVAGSPFATGANPQSVAFDPSGSLLATANFDGDTVSVFSIGGSGSSSTLTPVSGSPFATGGGPESVAFGPSGARLAVANSGANTVSMFSVGGSGVGTKVTPVSGSPFATGANPRSVAFGPSGGLLATADAGADAVSLFSVSGSGVATTLTPVSGSPFATGTRPVSLTFGPSRALLATADAGSNTVSAFSLSGSGVGATLTPLAGSPFATGADPMAVAFSPTRGLLAVANTGANSVSAFTVGPPIAVIGSPAGGGTYVIGESVQTRFLCLDAAHAPGIASCIDSNGASAPLGSLNTTSLGSHTYAVTAVSSDGQTGVTNLSYHVEALWTRRRSGTIRNLYAVACVPTKAPHRRPSADCWAVGARGSIVASRDAGTTWRVLRSKTRASLRGVFFFSPMRGFAVGTGGTILSTNTGGAHWTRISASPATTRNFTAITCQRGGKRCWAVGSGVAALGSVSAKTWKLFRVRGTGGRCAGTTNACLNGVALTSNSEHFAVGARGDIFAQFDYSPGGWLPQLRLGSGRFAAIACTPVGANTVGHCIAVGADRVGHQTIYLTFNSGVAGSCSTCGWKPASIPAADTFAPLDGVATLSGNLAAQRAWTVGVGGLILRTNDGGVTWTQEPSGVKGVLSAISCPNVALPAPVSCVAVGNAGTILTRGL